MPDRLALTDRIERDFTYYAPTALRAEQHAAIRAKAKELALLIASGTRECREQLLAITALEEAVMWANAAIARVG